MSPEALGHYLYVWISHYISLFCLATVVIWAACAYILTLRWQRAVRDAGIYLLAIGILTLVLVLRPPNVDALYWQPLVWFCFSMLMMFELLWIAFLCEGICRWAIQLSNRHLHHSPHANEKTATIPRY